MNHQLVNKNESGELVTTTLAIAGGVEIEHASVILLVRKYLSDLAEFGLVDFKSESSGGRPTEYALLNEQQSTLLITYMRNSEIVRKFKMRLVKAFYDSRAEIKLPSSFAEALRLAADKAEEAEQLAIERDHAIATKAQIGSKREATAMATAAKHKREAEKLKHELGRNSRHATIIAVERATGLKFPKNAYVASRKWCKKNNTPSVDVVDDRYGSVKAWPAGAWLAEFDVDLAGLFVSEAA